MPRPGPSFSAHPEDAPDATLTEQVASLRHLIPYLWNSDRPDFKRRILAAIAVILIGQVLTVATPFALAAAVNRLAENDPGMGLAYAVTAFIFGYGALRLLTAALPQMREFLFSVVGQNAQREVALDVFRHLHRLSLRFHLERRTGGLSRLIDRGVSSIDFLFRFLIFNIGPTLVQLVLVSAVFGIRYSGWLVLIVVVTVGAYFAFTIISTEWRLKFRREMNSRDQLAKTRALDAMLNFETVKYFGNDQYEADRYNGALETYQNAAVRSQNSLAIVNIGQSFVISLGLVLAIWLVARDVSEGRLGIGEITGVSLIMVQLYQPLNILGFAYREIKQALIDMEKMFSLLKIEPEIQDSADANPLDVTAGAIRFDDVHFAYDPARPILRGVSFEVPAGKTVAIVGPSGAGKSTIARLLFRFYDPTAGHISVDGHNIATATQASLRDKIGVVPQDTVLFNDTIGYNIAYGRPGADKDAIETAAKLAQIDGFIADLPDGFETTVGERGLKLSGGEKQRVAIARTILKDPPLLILDEATSALDSATEQGILDALHLVAKDRTTIVIAHRLSTIIDADDIIVLDEGRVAEHGNHADLLAQNGLYAALWARQSDGYDKTGAASDDGRP